MAIHSSILAEEIPHTEEPGSPWGWKRVRYNLAAKQPTRQGVTACCADNYLLFVLCPHMVGGEGQVEGRGFGGGGVFPFKGTNPIMRTSPS